MQHITRVVADAIYFSSFLHAMLYLGMRVITWPYGGLLKALTIDTGNVLHSDTFHGTEILGCLASSAVVQIDSQHSIAGL
jgi:hypothetical protein